MVDHFLRSFGLFKQTLQIYNKIDAHPVSSAGIQTHSQLNIGLLP